MNGVIGMTELLLDTKLDAEQEDCTEVIHQSAMALLTIINDILDFSKIEAGRLTLENTSFQLSEELDSAMRILSPRAHEKGIELICDLDPNTADFIVGDPVRLRQIVLNLVGNAIKFTTVGHVKVAVTKESSDAESLLLRFMIADTGEGLDQQGRERLFEAFTQADVTTTRRFGGTGLGLSISKSLVEMMGGTIGVESTLGQGSVFWFTARFETLPNDIANANLLDASFLKGRRALIVDDNQINRRILMKHTESWGMQHSEAGNSMAALALLDSGEKYDVVLSDMQMPDISGIDLAREMKQRFDHSPPVIILTSGGDRLTKSLMETRGIHSCLQKPLSRTRVYAALVALFSGVEVKRQNGNKIQRLEQQPERSESILLVEDNNLNVKLAVKLLSRFGFHVDVANDGLEALRAIENKQYNLVLMDCQMPEMDGYEATREIRKPESKVLDHNVPVIALTAHAMKGEREKCMQAGMDDYISKPVKPQELSEILEKWLTE